MESESLKVGANVDIQRTDGTLWPCRLFPNPYFDYICSCLRISWLGAELLCADCIQSRLLCADWSQLL